MKTATRVETEHASRYLQQLCKHFAHKIETSFDAQTGMCRFQHSTARLNAEAGHLRIEIEGEDEDALAAGQNVIWRHLERFAFREDLGSPDWEKAE